MHLDPEQIQRWLHGELQDAARSGCEAHVAACSDCRARLDAARQEETELFALLHHLDRPVPRVLVTDVVAHAHGADDAQPSRPSQARLPAPAASTTPRQPRPARGASRRRPQLVGWQRRAAAVVLVIGCGGVAYALPGSPLPGWIEQAARWATGADTPPAPVPPAVDRPIASSLPVPPPITAGIAVAPGERFLIRFAQAQGAGAVTVLPTDGHDIVVQARNGAPTFTTHAGGLLIDNAGSTADYQIELPRGAPWVEIQVAGRRVYLKEAAAVFAPVTADTAGRYILDLKSRER